MPTAAILRRQIESALAEKIPSALSPRPRMSPPVAATGIAPLDELLQGGLPVGAISEISGPECSGRTAVALSFLAQVAQGQFCAWVDASDAMDPASAASVGVDLSRLLWVRCGVESTTRQATAHRFRLAPEYLRPEPAAVPQGLPTGSFGIHPRDEGKGMPEAVGNFFAPRCAEPQKRNRPEKAWKQEIAGTQILVGCPQERVKPSQPWPRIEQALRAADLILQTGGFRAMVLDLGSFAPEVVTRIPLATWFRYRAAAERTQASLLLVTQSPCAKSSSELLLRMAVPDLDAAEPTVFTGFHPRAEVVRRRFAIEDETVVPIGKPPQRARVARWGNRTSWAGPR
jgi:RecA/RadA recombinase